MLNTVLSILFVAVTAAIGENVVFTRALGDGGLSYNSFTPEKALINSIIVGAASLAGALCGWVADWLLDMFFPIAAYFRPPFYLALYIVVLVIVILILKNSKNVKHIADYCVPIVMGYIPLATMFIIGTGAYSLAESIAYGIGVGIGYLLAMLLIWVLRERSLFSSVPNAFKGLPISLLYIGLVSLAIFGILGHQAAI